MDAPELAELESALATDRTIDIITIGAKTGLQRATEIWFTNIRGRIVICGTPSGDGSSGARVPRDWLANLVANPEFLFCLKESIQAQLTAVAAPVRDPGERRLIMDAAETQWYRNRGSSLDELVAGSPIVDVRFTGSYEGLNA